MQTSFIHIYHAPPVQGTFIKKSAVLGLLWHNLQITMQCFLLVKGQDCRQASSVKPCYCNGNSVCFKIVSQEYVNLLSSALDIALNPLNTSVSRSMGMNVPPYHQRCE